MAGRVDGETVLVGWLRQRGWNAMVELTNALQDELPVIRVMAVGGDDDTFRLDRPLIDIDVFADTHVHANQIAQQLRADFHDVLRGSTTDTAVIGAVTTVSAPAWRPYENTGLRRVGATYAIHMHPVT